MQKGNVILAGVKYVYLIFFFALLSGMFYPIIEKGANVNQVVIGVLILFVGLAGALCLYKAGTSEKKQKMYLVVGFAILAVSLMLVFSAAGLL
jgi:hypothetical protein